MNGKTCVFTQFSAVALAGLLVSACGKQKTTVIPQRSLIANESGPLPKSGMASRLLKEQSAFLRKHAKDAVDWYPWCQEAFERAKKERKPILLSIGYASCPWSQKLQEHAFMDPAIGRFQNKHFVNILVDREERPDLNNSYLHYVFWKSKKSGWPMHVWMTPEGLPLYNGIYFPKFSEGAQPAWSLTLEHVAHEWESDPAYCEKQAKAVVDEYLTAYAKQWKGPDPEGVKDSTLVRGLTANTKPAEQLTRILKGRRDDVEQGLREMPAAVMKPMLEGLDMDGAEKLLAGISPATAAEVSAKGPEKFRELAYRRMAAGCRQLLHQKLAALYDPVNGGFSPPPRFLQPAILEMMVRYSVTQEGVPTDRRRDALSMVELTLSRAIRGGIRDQLDGGFHRYVNDSAWQLPQFEKMGYDQAYAVQLMLPVFQLTGDKEVESAIKESLNYLMTDLNHPQGGFYSAEGSSSMANAESPELLEGFYYLWNMKDVEAAAGAAAMPLLTAVFGLDEYGNLPLDTPVRNRLPRMNLLTIKKTPEEVAGQLKMKPEEARAAFTTARAALLAARSKRQRPPLDDKVLTGWTGLGVSALAQAGWTLKDEALTARAIKGMEFILNRLRTPDGGLIHTFLDGPSATAGFAEDYAGVVAGLLDLYECTADVKWLKAAHELQEKENALLWDQEDGGFYDGQETPGLFHRVKSMDESTELAASTSSTWNLMRLHAALGIQDYKMKTRKVVERYGLLMAASPGAFVRLIKVAESTLHEPVQIVVSGPPAATDRAAVLDVLRRQYMPSATRLHMDGGDGEKFITSVFKDLKLPATGSNTVVHICRGGKLDKTLSTPGELDAWLKSQFSLPPVK